jgi:hypothetical protein
MRNAGVQRQTRGRNKRMSAAAAKADRYQAMTRGGSSRALIPMPPVDQRRAAAAVSGSRIRRSTSETIAAASVSRPESARAWDA